MTSSRYTVYSSDIFLKDMKRFIKKKRFTKLKQDMEDFKNDYLVTGNFKGSIITEIDSNLLYKVRMANKTINVGQSNGFRIVYHVDYNTKTVVLHTIYYKKEENLSDDEIIKIVELYTS